MYVLTTTHDVTFGHAESTVLATDDLELAVKTAMTLKDYGYKFETPGCRVLLERLELNKIYPDFNIEAHRPVNWILIRIWDAKHGIWLDKWNDDDAEKQFKGKY